MWGVLIFAPIIGILGFIVSSAIAYNIFFYKFYDFLCEVKDNDGKVAKTIADEAGNECKAMQIQSLHNVSLDDFKLLLLAAYSAAYLS